MPRLVRFRVSHLVLDVDGTLVDWESAYAVASAAGAEHVSALLGRPVAAVALQQARDRVAEEPAWAARTLVEVRNESLRRVLVAGGVSDPAAVQAVSETYYRTRNAHLRPFDDVDETLAELHARGFVLIAASNGNARLERLPLFRYLAAVHLAGDTGVSKPDPRFFAHALATVGARPEAALAVGDRVEHDVLPARLAGLQALLIDRTGASRDAELPRIESLSTLLEIVELREGV